MTILLYVRNRQDLLGVLLPDDKFIEILNKLCITRIRSGLFISHDNELVYTWRGVATPAGLVYGGSPKSSPGGA